MSNLPFIDGQGNPKYMKALGAGTEQDPLVVIHSNPEESETLGNLSYAIGDTRDGIATVTEVADAYGNTSRVVSNATVIQLLKSIFNVTDGDSAVIGDTFDCVFSLLSTIGAKNQSPVLIQKGLDSYGNDYINLDGQATVVGLLKAILLTNNKSSSVIYESPLTNVETTPVRSAKEYSNVSYQVEVSGIGTNIVMRLEGKIGGSTFANLNNSDTTITTNGSYLLTFGGKISDVRLNILSINGGNPTINASLMMGN